jgi:hypothetical protein
VRSRRHSCRRLLRHIITGITIAGITTLITITGITITAITGISLSETFAPRRKQAAANRAAAFSFGVSQRELDKLLRTELAAIGT